MYWKCCKNREYCVNCDNQPFSALLTMSRILSHSYNILDVAGSDGKLLAGYTYSAAGEKLSVLTPTGSGVSTEYRIGPFLINTATVSPIEKMVVLSKMKLPWAEVLFDETTLVHVTDYQGNVRAVVEPSSGIIATTTDYYPYGLPMPTGGADKEYRYKFGGKEYETDKGLNFHDFEARMLFNDRGLFNRPDPKAIEYPGFNPYLYCAGNPLRYVDPSGEEPSVYEAILMAIYSYLDGSDLSDIEEQLRTNGWKISNMADDLTLNDEKTGLNSMVFERTKDGQIEYAYVYTGTADKNDKICDYALVNGVVHPQITQALDNAQTIDQRAKEVSANVTYVGHSLGGFLASVASRKTNNPAMTFNPAGTHPLYDAKLALMPPTKVTNYVIMGRGTLFTDPVFTAGAIHGIYPSGKIVPVSGYGAIFPHGIRNFKRPNL